MKFTLKTQNLKKGLEVVNHATVSIKTTPILGNILLRANYKNLVITANNLEIAIEYLIDEGIEIESEGSICVPSSLFTSYISLLEDDEVDIKLKPLDNSLQIETKSSKLQIKGIDSREFPLIPGIREETSLDIESDILKKSIEKTLFSSAEGYVNPTLAGIFAYIKGKSMVFVSTDSLRLSEYRTEIESYKSKKFSQIIPSKAVFELKSILKDNCCVKIISGDSQIIFLFGNTKFYSRLLNGKFPDYSTFLPTSYSTKLETNRIDLIQALKKINLISRENNYSIQMSVSSDTGILLETSETQIGEGEVRLKGDIEGEDSIIGLNSEYFLEALNVMDSTHIVMSFEGSLSPILIKPVKVKEDKKDKSSFAHIIMPLKI